MMMKGNFIAVSANISETDPLADGFPMVCKTHNNTHINTLIPNSVEFDETSCTLVFRGWKDCE